MNIQLSAALTDTKEPKERFNNVLVEACDTFGKEVSTRELRMTSMEKQSGNANIEVKRVPTHASKSVESTLHKMRDEIA